MRRLGPAGSASNARDDERVGKGTLTAALHGRRHAPVEVSQVARVHLAQPRKLRLGEEAGARLRARAVGAVKLRDAVHDWRRHARLRGVRRQPRGCHRCERGARPARGQRRGHSAAAAHRAARRMPRPQLLPVRHCAFTHARWRARARAMRQGAERVRTRVRMRPTTASARARAPEAARTGGPRGLGPPRRARSLWRPRSWSSPPHDSATAASHSCASVLPYIKSP